MKTFYKFVLSGILCSSLVSAEELNVAASDLLAEFISPSLEAFASDQSIDLTVESLGSLPALDRLSAAEVDLAIIAVPEGSEVPRDEYRILPLLR